MPRQIAIRLGTEGRAQVIADLDAIGTTGDAAFNRIAKAAAKSGRDADEAIAAANRSASKLAALLPGLNPTKLDMAAGVRDGIGKSAESSAAIFEAAYSKMEARAVAFRAALDPAYGAQQRFNREMAEARSLISNGAISMDEYVAKLRQQQAALDGVAGTGRRAGNAFAAAAPQVQDLFTQISMGGNPVNALVVQGGQLAGQWQYAGGKAEAFSRVLMGPYGIAAQAALLVLSPLLGKMLDFGNAVDDATDKLKKDAAQTEATRIAKERFAKTAEGVAAAIRDGTAATLEGIKADKSSAEQANINAKNNLAEEIAIRRKTLAKLADAKAAAGEMLGDDPGIGAQIGRDLRVSQLEKDLKEQAGLIKAAEARVQETRIALSTEAAARMVDPMARIKKRYDDLAAAARNEAREAAKAGKDVTAALTQRLGAIERDRAATIKAEQDKQSALHRTAKVDQETATASQIARMLRTALPGVQVTSTTGGKHVANSYHYRNQAIDFVPKGGMGSMTKADVRKLFTDRGINIAELLGPGDKGHSDHFHVAWTKGKLALDNFNASAKDGKDALRELGKAQRELESDLEDIVGRFDPARAAGDAYADTLAKIALLRGKGKLTADQSAEYTFGAMREEQARDDAARANTIKNIFGDVGDPIGDAIARNDAEAEVKRSAFDAEEDRRQRVQANGIRTIADLYSTAMTGGTQSLFQSFKQMGMNAITDLAAKWTMSQIGKLAGGGGFVGRLAGLFSGAAKAAPALTGVPKLASGTEYWSGGTALLGEHGPERAWLPTGTRVSPAGATRRDEDTQGSGGRPVFQFDLRGAVMTQDLLDQMNAIGTAAAVQGAAGGSQMAQATMARMQRRSLGRG